MNIKTVLSAFTVAITSCFVSHSTILAASPRTWAESYGVGAYLGSGKHADSQFSGSGDDYPVGIAKMPDGGVVVAGQVSFPALNTNGGLNEAVIVRFAPDGSIVWQRAISLSAEFVNTPTDVRRSNSYVYGVAADAQGNVFICGGKGNPSNGGQIPFVTKFSSAGALVWQNGIKGAATKEGDPPQTTNYGVVPFKTMSLTPDGGVLVGFGQNIRGNSYSLPSIAKFNSDGSLAMFATFDFNKLYTSGKEGYAIQYLDASAVAVSRDGSKYVTLLQYPVAASVNPSSRGLTAVITDPAGNVVGVRSFVPSDGRLETPISIIATADKGFATLSWIAGNFLADGGFCVRKFNGDLSRESFEKVFKPASQNTLTAMSLTEAADGALLIGGHKNPAYGGFEDAMILKLNAAGTPQFASLLGGPRIEGGPSKQYAPDTGAYLVQTADGGYAFAVGTLSYGVDTSLNYTNWWVVKTDAKRRVRNYKDSMVDQSLDVFTVKDTTRPPDTTPYFNRISPDAVSAVVSNAPAFSVDDPATFAAPDAPELLIQASGPRIVSETRAEAVVGQHFSFQIRAAFFPDFSKVTFAALGLPTNFKIDPKTGVISGVAGPNSETTQPIDLLISATDKTETVDGALHLTIGDGSPLFTVDGSDQPTTGLSDTVLTFAAQYPGNRAGQLLTVQSATNPQGPWTDLPTATSGAMAPDFSTGTYGLATTNYPQQNAVYFRSRVKLPGNNRPDVFSNVVGPFNLTSSKTRAGKVAFRLVRNSLRADLDFRATILSPASGVALRVQSSRTPEVEASWSDLVNSFGGNLSAMNPDGDAAHYAALVNGLGDLNGVYFRAVASGSGVVDAISNFIGSYKVSAEKPPSVTVDTPSGGTADNPLIVRLNENGVATLNIHATAAAATDRTIDSVSVLVNGNPIYTIEPHTANATIEYQKNTNVLGDYVIEAIAFDNHVITARAGTSVRYVRVLPALNSGSRSSVEANSSAAAATFRREVYTVAKSGGNWNESSTWRDSRNRVGVPTSADFVIIGNSTVKLNGGGGTVFSMSLNGGHIVGPGQLQIDGSLSVGAGSFDAGVVLVVKSSAVCTLLNAAAFHFDGVFQNQGTVNVHGAGSLLGLKQFLNLGSVNLQLPLLPSAAVAAALAPATRSIEAQFMPDTGKIAAQRLINQDGASLINQDGASLINQDGASLINQDGASLINQDGGSIITHDGGSLLSEGGIGLINQDGASLINQDGASIIGPDGASLINQDGASLINQDGASLLPPNGASFKVGGGSSASNSQMRAATAQSGYVKQGGETDLSGIAIIGPVTLKGGVLSGSGVIQGDVTNNGGYISPGHSAGAITIAGNFTQNSGGTTVIEAADAAPGMFDRLQVSGTARLGGKLDLKLINGYIPLANDPINPINASTLSGSFGSVSSNGKVVVNSTGLSVTLDPAKPNPESGRPLNISTRMEVRTGENVLIAGFIVTGPAGSTKKVLIRGLGPSLPVSGSLADPLLEFHGPNGSVVTNDSWKSNQQAEINATTIPPKNDKEAAIVATIPVGSAGYTNCTAVLKGAHGETGIGLVEVYDLNTSSPAKLANISTRGFVDTGDNVMIGGFIVGGGEPAKMLIRAIGPSLPVAGKLKDTVLDLHDQNGAIVTNDDWRGTQESEVKATTIPPSSEQESAIVATLVPGNYTAVVRGKNNTTGVGLVEAYNLR